MKFPKKSLLLMLSFAMAHFRILSFLKIFSILLFILLCGQVSGQEVNVGADLVSRYVWRGLDIANSPSLQPKLSITQNNFEAGVWGAYSLSNNNSVSDEIDAWLGYKINSGIGDFTFSVINYYFPNAGLKLGNLKNGSGAHTLEGNLLYSGPISILVAFNFHNDTGKNVYFELGYSADLKDVALNFFVGGTPGSKENPAYYGADNFSLIKIGITASKKIKFSDNFSLPVFTSFIINPRAESAHLVFGVSI
jgi:hypothetical protein